MKEIDRNIAEAIIRIAVIENHDEELKLLDGDVSPISFSNAHEKRMNRLFFRSQMKHIAVSVWAVTRKAATAAAFAIAILTFVLLLNPKVQATVANVIIEFFAEFTSFRFNGMLNETTKNVEWELSWLPETFSETYREYDAGVSRAGYTNTEGLNIRFTATPAESNEINVDNENAVYIVKTKDGIEYHIFSSIVEEAPSVIIWTNNGYDFIISAYCDVETLEEIAYSVRETEN